MDNSLDKRHKAVLDDVPLGLGKCTATGQSVDGVQHRVDHDSTVVSASEQWGALCEQRQHS